MHKKWKKFLHRNKQQLDTQLYHIHIYTWQQTCINIEQSVNQKLQQEMTKIHQKQQKTCDLSNQTTNTVHNNTDYNRIWCSRRKLLQTAVAINTKKKH
jgi:hypothetical protein